MPFLATRRKKQRFGCLLGPALFDSLELSQHYLMSECEVEGPARCGSGGREWPASSFPLEAHTPQESRRVCIRRGGLVLSLCAGQIVGGEALHGT